MHTIVLVWLILSNHILCIHPHGAAYIPSYTPSYTPSYRNNPQTSLLKRNLFDKLPSSSINYNPGGHKQLHSSLTTKPPIQLRTFTPTHTPIKVVALDIIVEGLPSTLILDTGSPQSLIKSSQFDDLKGKNGQHTFQVRVEDINIPIEFNLVEDTNTHSIPKGVDGILGLDFLRYFRAVFFDLAENIIIFCKDKSPTQLFNSTAFTQFNLTNDSPYLSAHFDLKTPSSKLQINSKAIFDLGSEMSVCSQKFVSKFDAPTRKTNQTSITLLNNRTFAISGKMEIDKLTPSNSTGHEPNLLSEPQTLYVVDPALFDQINSSAELIFGRDILLNNKFALDFQESKIFIETPFKPHQPPVDNENENPRRIEMEANKIKSDLINGKLKFNTLQSELTNSQILFKNCKTTDELIDRVAHLRILGPDKCRKQFTHTEDIDIENIASESFDKTLEQLENKLENMENNKKVNFLENIKSFLEKNGVNKKLSNSQDILEAYAHHMNSSNADDKTEADETFKRKSVPSYSRESEKLWDNLQSQIGDLREKTLDNYKEELIQRKIPFDDCKNERDIVNRLAYARVFSKPNKKENSEGRKRIQTQRIIRHKQTNLSPDLTNLSSFLESPFEQIFQQFFGNSLFNGPNIREIFNSNSNGNSFVIHIGGDDFDDIHTYTGNAQKQLEFQPETKQKKNQNEKVDTDKKQQKVVEKNPVIIEFLEKVKSHQNPNLTAFFEKALEDTSMKQLIITAMKKGYDKTFKEYKKDSRALYLLEKLRDNQLL